jgi:dTDP-4-amino-4,6-dideoxygalactose transaminase
LGHKPGDFPATEKAVAEILSLPIYAEMTDGQLHDVANGVKELLKT